MTHEDFTRGEQATLAGERSFAMVMAAAFMLLSAWSYWWDGRLWPWWAAVAIAFVTAGVFRPRVLRPLNWVWFKFGMLLHAVVSPAIMGVVFFVAVWPTGLVMRALGRDLLRLRFEPDAVSYWIARRPPGPSPETMKDQF